MDYKNLNNLLVEVDNHLAIIKLNRPKALNALNKAILDELDIVTDALNDDSEIRVVIITGEGEKAFAAGADVSEMANLSSESGKNWGLMGSKIFRKIETSKNIYIAAINGFALGGGCELAMACDLRIAAKSAILGQPEVALGIIPGFSGTQRLQRLVGAGKAKELIYTCDKIPAEEALTIGLVNHVVENEELMTKAREMAEKILKNSFHAVRLSKEAVNLGAQMDIDSAIEVEANLFGLCFAHNDQKEGMSAFLEKRKPKYS
ncbi:enoyl-CoA hydratase-related protein [Fusobacterium sp. PH5-44]|uniref:enoyl-CoA hydratase-related protein n=1 Tax=unclassified Fusobacterium TaxID=2648384 RepID=UPI003D195028